VHREFFFGGSAATGLKIFRAKSIFRASASSSKVLNGEHIFNTVYVYLGVIGVI